MMHVTMKLRQSNPIQMFIKLGSAMITWNADSQTLYDKHLYRVLLTKFHGIIALPSLINICIGFDNDPMELRQSNPIQMFIKLDSAMIHGTPTVKP
jgi:hypothetical protein